MGKSRRGGDSRKKIRATGLGYQKGMPGPVRPQSTLIQNGSFLFERKLRRSEPYSLWNKQLAMTSTPNLLISFLKTLIFCVSLVTLLPKGALADLQITEFMAAADSNFPDTTGAPSDWVEISNTGAETVSLKGYFLTNNAADLTRWAFPHAQIEAGGSLLVFASGKTQGPPETKELHTNFTLDRGGDYLALIAPDGVTAVSEFKPIYPEQFLGISYGFGFSGANTQETLVKRDGEAKYFIASDDSLGDTWKKAPSEFDDSGWANAIAGLGFEVLGGTLEQIISTNIAGEMKSVNASGFFRFPFQFDMEEKAIVSLQLKIHIDDGFVAYLNGTEVGSFRKPLDLQWNSTATSSPSRSDTETVNSAIIIDITTFKESIKDGENILAIQGMNRTSGGSDFVIDAELLADVRETTSSLRQGYFEDPSPGLPNSTVKNSPPAQVDFSVLSGLFTENFQIELSSSTPGVVIRYTTDLTIPTNTADNPSPIYTGPIKITESMQIRAQAFLNGSLDGEVRTETFLKMSGDVPAFSSDLPVVILSTLGTGPPPGTSSTKRKTAFMFFFEPDPETGRTVLTQSPALTTRAGIRRRGSSSGGWPKWSLSVETWRDGDDEDRNIKPFGMPTEADWVLGARYEWDLALMRNPFVYEISRQIDRYAPRTQFVEVFADTTGSAISDNDYFGVYSLIEKIEMDKNRVDVARIKPWEDSEPKITGGYIFKNDRPDPGEPTINVRGMGQITLVDPDGGEISGSQRSWLINHLNNFDRAVVNHPEGINPTTGLHYSDYIDVDSWIDHHWLNIMVMNIDWGRHSAFFHKDRSGKIVSGPVWDYDRALGCEDVRDNQPRAWEGVVNAVGTVSSKTWFDARFPWYGHLLGPNANPAQANYPDIRQRHTDRWFDLRKGEFSIRNLHAVIDSMADEIRESQARNFERWKQHPPNGGNFSDPDLTGWEAEISHMKNWLVARTEWVDEQYLKPPVFNTAAGVVDSGFQLVMGSPDGQIFYTTDGSDPRASGGLPTSESVPFQGGPVEEILIDINAAGRYLVPEDDTLGLTWTEAPGTFDDSTWKTATNGVGFETSGGISELISTNIREEMRSINASCYLRLPFNFDNTENVNSITLTVWSDDGFVAYLNGTEVGSLLKPSPLMWNSRTDGGKGFPGGDTAVLNAPIILDLTPYQDQLQNGANVIALHGMNSSPGGSDFLVRSLLSINHNVSPTPVTVDRTQILTARTFDGSQWSAPEQVAMITSDALANNSNLVISEIMFRPLPPNEEEIAAGFNSRDDFEFLELFNISDKPVAIVGIIFSDGIEFDFNNSPIKILKPGARGLLVNDQAAFEFRYGTSLTTRILGEFQNGTKLKNEGERLSISALNGESIRNFAYDNKAPWPSTTEEGGFSLVLRDPKTNPDHKLAENWKLSTALGGTPGTADDLNFDTWADAYGNPAPQSDHDFDGRVALIEYAMGTNPTISDSVVPQLETGEFLTFLFRKNSLAEDLTLTLEQSVDLKNWVEASDMFTLIGEPHNIDGTTTLIYRSTSPKTEGPLFLRMRAILQ
ncbi:CotH kinase family protein [Akkermansiaceae bacterium]|nr:CotH kinase family protein [Akkermansiaceae bacterium]